MNAASSFLPLPPQSTCRSPTTYVRKVNYISENPFSRVSSYKLCPYVIPPHLALPPSGHSRKQYPKLVIA